MFNKLRNIALLALLFAQFVIADQVLWPTNFEGQYADPPHLGGLYGCSNISDVHSLTLDFINNKYTKIHWVCDQGNHFVWGERGLLQVENEKAIIIHTETGFGETVNGPSGIEWFPLDPVVSRGYFTFDAADQHVNEFDNDGNFLVHWPLNQW